MAQPEARAPAHLRRATSMAAALVATACGVGPAYRVPRAPVPLAAHYKEAGWKVARPADAIPRGAWWTMFAQPELDALEAQLAIANQTIVVAAESYLGARALIRVAEAQYFPTLSLAASAAHGRSPGVVGANPTTLTGGLSAGGGTTVGPFTSYILAGEASWAPDLFGRVRYTVRQRRYTAQASAADLENVRLQMQAALAQAYFQLRAQDALQELLDATVATNEEILALIRQRFDKGLENEATLVQAEQTLEASRAQATNAGILRAQYEHAIAVLIGVPVSDFALPRRALLAAPPQIPTGAPSQLLERRPDIAAAERRMAAANAAIGIGYTAYFPAITLTGVAGVASQAVRSLFDWQSRLWSAGGTLAQTVFDGGARAANIAVLTAQYDATVADYRQTVLVAFQQVEDTLAQTRILVDVVERQRNAVRLLEHGLDLERSRYAAGLDPYITLMTQQTAVLSARQLLVSFEVQRIVAAVQLVQALGGGWERQGLAHE
ncbi:MAG: efflux transporter outer membrane subunit [Deltaproteobacteria bacterium]|nr:efflux transporter outer membrane subunit [Deltaproteobacteria bacterium]